MNVNFGKSLRKYMRRWHRDVGYFLFGLTVIYGVSGIILNFKQKEVDPAYKSIAVEKMLPAGLSSSGLKQHWPLDAPGLSRVYEKQGVIEFYLTGGMGEYRPADGYLYYQIYRERKAVKFMNDIHYNVGKKYTWLGTFVAAAFLFLGISGLIMVKGKNGFKKRGLYFAVAGLLLPLLWYFVF